MWQDENRRRCQGCHRWEWEFEEDPDAWEADLYVCPGCQRIDTRRRDINPDTELLGMHIGWFRPERRPNAL